MPCKFLMLYCIFIFINSSCDEHSITSNKESGDSLEFDSETYELANYIQRMNAFLDHNSQKVNKSTDYIVVLNASQCSSCVQAQFSNFTNKLNDFSGKFLVISDDSSFIHSTHDSSIRFEIFPRDLFDRFDVVHRNIYIYSMDKGRIHSTELLTNDKMDSLIHSE